MLFDRFQVPAFADRLLILVRNAGLKFAGLMRRRRDFVRESWGAEYSDKVFLVVRRSDNCGLSSYVYTALAGIKYAYEHGMIPVIDMQTGPNIYLRPEEVGKVNAWEFFFEQPAGFSLKDMAHARNVVISKDVAWPDSPCPYVGFLKDENPRLAYWRDMVRRYVRVTPEFARRFELRAKEVLGEDMSEVLGVFLRGTDYVRLRPYLHTVQPDPSVVIKDVSEALSRSPAAKILVVSEDFGIWTKLKNAFGERAVTFNRFFLSYSHGFVGDRILHEKKEFDRRAAGDDYLCAIRALALCTRSFESIAGGSGLAGLFSKKGRDPKYYKLGLYGRFGVVPMPQGDADDIR